MSAQGLLGDHIGRSFTDPVSGQGAEARREGKHSERARGGRPRPASTRWHVSGFSIRHRPSLLCGMRNCRPLGQGSLTEGLHANVPIRSIASLPPEARRQKRSILDHVFPNLEIDLTRRPAPGRRRCRIIQAGSLVADHKEQRGKAMEIGVERRKPGGAQVPCWPT